MREKSRALYDCTESGAFRADSTAWSNFVLKTFGFFFIFPKEVWLESVES